MSVMRGSSLATPHLSIMRQLSWASVVDDYGRRLMVRIAVDAMGGDHAPGPIVAGTIRAARELRGIETLYLVGDEQAIEAECKRQAPVPSHIEIIHATEIVAMDEPPATAVRRKKDSSICRAVDLVKEGRAGAVFSAGNTGASVAATTLKLRTLEGVDRPAIAAVFQIQKTPFVLLDAGANTDCTSDMLLHFSVMGNVYSREILHVPSPVIGLLSIGEEDAKGNEMTKDTFRKLDRSGLNFIGNVESRDLFNGKIDVAICDGFVGNIVLKTSESAAKAVENWIKEELASNLFYSFGAFFCQGAFKRIKEKSDPSLYGGAPLLGVNGVCIIGHGSSNEIAVANAIRVASESVEHHINPQIIESVRTIKAAV